MSFSFNSEYKYIYKADFNPNISFVSKVYTPLITKDAYCLYSVMCEEHKNISRMRSFKNIIREIANSLDLSFENLEEAKNRLEAFGLLKTYKSEDDGQMYFELFEPLNFDDFSKNASLLKNLEDRVGKNTISKLFSEYGVMEIPDKLIDVTVNKEAFLNKLNFKETSNFNFEELYAKITKTSKFPVNFSDDVIKEMDNYFTNYNLSMAEIEKCVYSSIVKNNNEFEVCPILISKELNDLSSKDFESLDQMVTLNHNKKIFIEKSSAEDLANAFNNYKNFNSEQFYSSLTSDSITEHVANIFDVLRKKFSLNDAFINLMVDYSIRKTHGELNEKYLTKMAKSFRLENVESLQDAYNFLMNWDSKSNNSTNNKRSYVKKSETVKNNIQEPIKFDNVIESNTYISTVCEDDETIDLSFIKEMGN